MVRSTAVWAQGGRTMPYWFCLQHMDVEPDEGCGHADRLGPYPTAEVASEALARARARSQEWDEDEKWRDDDWRHDYRARGSEDLED